MKPIRFIAAFTLVLLIATASAFAAPAMTDLKGQIFPKPWTATDFTLTDQHGKVFRMADTRGKVVVMTYIYTHCTDFCPFVALKLRAAEKILGADASKAVFVAVTTDPERDTPQVCADYSKAIGMYD